MPAESTPAERSVAYVLKGYPRRSELFIASEIHRLERLGLKLRLYVVKPPEETTCHPVVERIVAQPTYLPPMTSLSSTSLVGWLRANLSPFLGPLARTARRHPVGLARAAGRAAVESVRARKGWRPRKIFLKELLAAVALADELADAPEVAHLHAHFAHGTTTITWLAATICGLPFSFTGHAKDIYQTSLNPAGLLARKLEAAQFTATCTGANLRHLRAIVPDADVQLVYHGLNADFAELVALAAAPPPPPATLRVISVGRLVPKKGFDVLLDAVEELADRGVDVELTIAGEDGDAGPEIRRRLAGSALAGRVELRGPLTQRELFDEYRRSTLFALACRVDDSGDRDGIPNVLTEAMAAGLAVVSTSVSGIPELVESGRNGLLVPAEDPAALADAVLRVGKDPELRRRLAAAGARTVRDRFDGEVLAARMAELFATSKGARP